MKYFISLISALLFTFTVFAQGVLEIKQSRPRRPGFFLPATKPADSMLSGALPYTASELTNEQEEV